ncbi:hypothetical protein BDC45DRAFT_568790 [Circinella umbellata]|nr:hypothetical protein BDC45DRAFT_568790 [Circinella umbellata]
MATLEECLTNILGGIARVNGGPLEISTVIEHCIHGPVNKHYEFLGQGALELALSICIRQQFGQYNSDVLQHMRLLMTRNHFFARALAYIHNIHKLNNDSLLPETVAERIAGVVQELAGLNAVVTMVGATISENGCTLFNKLPRSLRISMGLLSPTEADSQDQEQQRQQRPIAIPRTYSAMRSASNPYSDFKQLIEQGNGTINISWDARRSESDHNTLEWGCKFTYQMTGTSVYRSHIRYGQNKKKAKTLVARDIIDYYEKRPDELDHDKTQQLQGEGFVNNDIPLAIDSNEYSHEGTNAPPPLSSSSSLSTTPSPITPGGVLQTTELYGLSSSSNNINPLSDAIHIPDNKRGRSMEEDDEYLQHMKNVLLGVEQVSLDSEQQQQQQDIVPKRHKSIAMDCTTTTFDITTKKTVSNLTSMEDTNMMMISTQEQPKQHPAAALLPDTIYPPNAEPVSPLSALRKIIDIAKLDKILSDPVQATNPKSSLFSYIRDIPDLRIKSEFQEEGPPHQKIFQATSTIYSVQGYTVSGTGKGLKKSDAEQMAILDLMKNIVNPSF